MRCTNSNIWVVLLCFKHLNQWFLNASTFGRPNKVLLLSHRYTQCLPDMAASTLLRLLIPRLLSLCEHFSGNMQIFPHSDVDMSLWFWDFSLCSFRDLIYVQTACNTPKRNENLKLHHMTPLNKEIMLNVIKLHSTEKIFTLIFNSSVFCVISTYTCMYIFKKNIS